MLFPCFQSLCQASLTISSSDLRGLIRSFHLTLGKKLVKQNISICLTALHNVLSLIVFRNKLLFFCMILKNCEISTFCLVIVVTSACEVLWSEICSLPVTAQNKMNCSTQGQNTSHFKLQHTSNKML